MFEEMLAKYVMNETVYDVYAIYHSPDEMYIRKLSFYEVYENVDGKIKRVDTKALYTMPTWNEVYHTYYALVK